MLQSDSSKRSKNFRESEVIVLLSLVEQYKDILLNKQTDKATVTEKRHAWQMIEQEFNETPGMVYFRDFKTLHSKYDNLKKIAKKRWIADQKDTPGTEEHPNQSLEIASIDVKLKELLGHSQEQEIPAVFGLNGDILYGEEESESYGLDSAKSPESSSTSIQFDLTSLPVALEEEIAEFPDHCYSIFTKPNSPSQIDKSTTVPSDKSTPSSGTSCGKFSVVPSLKKRMNANPSAERKLASTCASCGANVYDSSGKMGSAKKSSSVSRNKYKAQFSSLTLNKRKRTASHLENSFPEKKIEQLSKKQDVLNLQKHVLHKQLLMQLEEHKLKLKCIQEKHDLEVKLLQLKVHNEELTVQKHMSELLKDN